MLSTQIYYGILEEFPTGVVQSPFFPGQSQPARAVKAAAAFAILGTSALLLTSTPFQSAQAAPARSIVRSAPDQVHSNLAIQTNPFVNFSPSVPQPPKTSAATQAYPNIPLLFGAPFTPIDWSRPRAIVPSKLPILIGFQIQYQIPPDTHDVYVKRKKRRQGPDPIELELEERARRRQAIELAVYGPEPSIGAPPPKPVKPAYQPPDVTDLTRIVLAAQKAKSDSIRAAEMANDEDDLESLLKDIL